jgi:hypothetical protein
MRDPSQPRPTPEEVAEERQRLRRVRILADLTLSILYQQPDLELSEAMILVSNTRRAMLALFPGQEGTYDLLYRPRFDRAIAERFGQPVQ